MKQSREQTDPGSPMGMLAAMGLWVVCASFGSGIENHAQAGSPTPALIMAKASGAPDRKQGGSDGSSGLSTSEVCETAGRKAYEACIDGSKGSQGLCLDQAEAAERKCLIAADLLPNLGTTSVKTSEGIYRIPYADGTKVHIMRNFQDHLPPGKIDMAARGGGTYRIVAAADGVIRYIEDSRDKQQHPQRWLRNTDQCFNNFLWIRHDNGEWTKYSHMQMGTSTAKAGLKVDQRVTAGTYLGDEGHVGCAWPGHLHFEVVVPASDQSVIDPIDGGFVGYNYDQARNPRFIDANGKVFTFQDGENYVANSAACRNDIDCNKGFYCNAGLDMTKNACLPLKNDNEACAAIGGGHQCKSGQCKFGRCFTTRSVGMGGTCYVNDACTAGKCSDLEGVKGVCVCQTDTDCNSDEYCDAGLDFKINKCRPKLNKGATCGKAGSVGNDHKCKSRECSGFPKYECK